MEAKSNNLNYIRRVKTKNGNVYKLPRSLNFLAHLLLSNNDDELKIGNYIGDFVKGNQLDDFPEGIRNGIILHRKIDSYTDQHEIVMESKKRLRPSYRHYAPVIVDMYYDHFLAANWSDYAAVGLKEFTTSFYELARSRVNDLPVKVRELLHHMSATDWLYHYKEIEGIDRALKGMSRRTRFNSGMENAATDLQKDYALYLSEFQAFFPELSEYCKNG